MRPNNTGTAVRDRQKHWLLLFSLVLLYAIFTFGYLYLSRNGYFRWPFRRVNDLSMAYQSVALYTPVMLVSLLSLTWLKAAQIPIREAFAWKKLDWLSRGVAVISLFYSIYLFVTSPFSFKGYLYWPPVLIMSLLNAFAEETFYRLSFMGLLAKVSSNRIVINLIQSFLYALPHYWIGGPILTFYAFGYGIVLGQMRQRQSSLVPCMIAHFLIDIGNIGLPFLIVTQRF